MTFLALDDQFPDHRKVAGLSDAAFRLHVAGLAYCARHLTDGHIPGEEIPRLVRRFRKTAPSELVDAGLWMPALNDYVVHDYLQWNPSREQVLARREKATKRKAAWRAQNGGQDA